MKKIKQMNVCAIIAISLVILSCIFMGSSKSVYAKTKNSNDVKALQNIITVQRNRGAKVSNNLNNKNQYKWSKKTGRLQTIWWDKKNLKGKINFNKFKELKAIYISKNKLTKIYVNKLTNLKELSCKKNKLTKINIKRNIQVAFLDCSNNKIKKLSVLNNKKLTSLYCSHNLINELEISKNAKALEYLYCSYNNISSLHIDELKNLSELDCSHNNMKIFSLKNMKDIFITCSYNNLKTLDFNNVSINWLDCSHNQLETLNTYGADKVNCSYNNIREITGNLNIIEDLICEHNRLTDINIDKKSNKLNWLNCQNNNISVLDLTGSKGVYLVLCDDNVKLIGEKNIEQDYPIMFGHRVYNNKVKYSLKNGILTVSGTGVMDNSFVNKFHTTDIKKVIIEYGIVGISDYSLQYCDSVSSIEIPESVTAIGNVALGTNEIKEVIIPKGVKKIGDRGLGNNNYNKITMPATAQVDYKYIEEENSPVLYKSAKDIYLNTDYNPDMKNVLYAKNIYTMPSDKKYKSIDGYVYTKDGKTLVQVPALEKKVVIKKGCRTILASSIGYFRLTGDGEEFTYLNPTSITIPKTVKTVKDDLKSFSVTFGKRVKWKLKTNKLSGRSIETLCALMTRKNQTEFFELKNAKIKQKGQMVITKDGVLIRYTGKASCLKIPNYVKRIGQLAFCSADNIKKVTLNKNLKYIGKSAFEGCTFLKKVDWNNKLKGIEEYAFTLTSVKKKKFSKKTKVDKNAFWS